MSNIIQGLFHTIQGLFESLLAVIQTFLNIIYSLIHGTVSLIWNLLENVAEFIGASVHFLISNIVIIGLILVGLVIYNDRNKRGTLGNDLKKKAQ
ncbi:uncharacterized protein I206_106913 [Kwoniella pini CBS 10737]|uniref:Uncharacterized protein n=1 Tax=Kwoniella pini CBS 10737 TaxID=1296096 RepID=A0A1B9HZW1_9TREE|nr:uncharacterized protein I206_05542 [Kwoniella pini CBS 10737]OCF48761.1 hypothetical protein I206_05542 [Kwoniella pini CBS 10737]